MMTREATATVNLIVLAIGASLIGGHFDSSVLGWGIFLVGTALSPSAPDDDE